MITLTNRIDQLFADRSKKRFIPFLSVGDPTLEISEQIIEAVIAAGADLIELGVAYSDPIADGPTIQRASQRALAAGVSITRVFELVSRLRLKGITTPLVFFSYYNPVLQYGIERFFAELSASGADGIIIPDLPIEENAEAVAAARKHGLHLISLIAPTSEARIENIAEQATGFIYCVASLGVTGVRNALSAGLSQFLEQVKSRTDKPIAVGFGISTPEQVKTVANYADGVVVGSAIVQEVERNLSQLLDPSTREEAIAQIKRFVQQLVSALQ